MQTPPTNPWHRESFDKLLQQRLPALLHERMGLRLVKAEYVAANACRIVLSGKSAHGAAFEVEYPRILAPDGDGVFRIEDAEPPAPASPARLFPDTPQQTLRCYAGDGKEFIVPVLADSDDLETARISCVGERLFEFIDSRLGHVPEEVELDADLVRRLVPLSLWVRAFLDQSAQRLNGNNWLDRASHLRRLWIMNQEEVFQPGHFGRTCPFETPEGPNVGRVLAIARGAEIRDGRLVIVDDSPVAGLGLAAASIPFLEHDDGNRVLMGANMMRQWLPAVDAEAPRIQTGLEPDADDFWCGRDLLSAFVSWDGDTYEDALLLSESAAKKLACPDPLEPGDKLSNRHGSKGVISRVVPDDDMPKLEDGTAVEIIYSVCGVPSRWGMGQLREAALSHVARARGDVAIVPPFGAPSDKQLKEQLIEAGLPESGLMRLVHDGKFLERGSSVGWVYWGCTCHLAKEKLHATTTPMGGQLLGGMEVDALREVGAHALVREWTNTCSEGRSDAATLAERLAAGDIEAAASPSPALDALRGRLEGAGIQVNVESAGVRFGVPASGARNAGTPPLMLAQPVAHPWLPDRELSSLSVSRSAQGLARVEEANTRLAGLLAGAAPETLMSEAREVLRRSVADLYSDLLPPESFSLGSRVLFSGRAVIAPGPELSADQLGIPQDMAWTLFGPLVVRELDAAAVAERTEAARSVLTQVMASRWVVLNRAPTVSPTSLIAFRPVLCPDKVIRLPLMACKMLTADFDGDQAAVFLPLTRQAQTEASEKLSIVGHLRRDPNLVTELFPGMDALLGLACLSRTAHGLKSIADAAGHEPVLSNGILTKDGVAQLLRDVLEASGPEATLKATETLQRLGFAASRGEGASVGPLIGITLSLPKAPDSDAVDQWQAYIEELWAFTASYREYDDPDAGAAFLVSHCGARSNAHQLSGLFGAGGLVHDVHRNLIVVRRCWREGLTSQDVLARVIGARRGLHRAQVQMSALGQAQATGGHATAHGVLARAQRSPAPGVVLARAASRGEVDPLEDDFARLFVGLG